MRNYVNKIIKQAKFEDYHKNLEKERNQPRKMWGALDEIAGRSSCKPSIEQFKFKNGIKSEKVKICKTFKKLFSIYC